MSGSWDNSTNQSINMTVGGVAAAGTGDYTVVVFVQTAGSGNSSWVSCMVSAVIGIDILADTGVWFGANDFSSGFGTAAASTWYMAGQSKVSGSNTYRQYLCSFGANGSSIGSPSHGVATGAGTHANPGTLTALHLGDGADKGNGLVAFVAIWKRVISDVEFDGLCTHNLSDVAALLPDALITLNNWNGSTGATDVVGTCTQSSITGAVQVGANPTGYSFALGGIPTPVPRTGQVRDYVGAQWSQRDRRDATAVASAANPLPSPLDSAWQVGGAYWHLYGDTAARDRRLVPQQRVYGCDPNLLSPPAVMPPPPVPRAVLARDPGEVQWLQRRYRCDPALLASAQLENELLGGAETTKRAGVAATHSPRWWAPRQPTRQAWYFDAGPDVPPLTLAYGDGGTYWATYNQAGWQPDRREMPQQRLYVSDPSFYPTTAPADPLTLAWGAGGPLWLLYNTAALDVDRREAPQQRRYLSDPGLLASALLENELLGGGDTARHLAWFADRRTTVAPRPVSDPAQLAAPATDPLTLAAGVGGDLWRRYNTPAYADRREVTQQPTRSTLYFDAGPGTPPLTLSWGAGGNLWHSYQWRRPAAWLPRRPVFAAPGDSCITPRPGTGTTTRPGSGTTTYATATTARPSSGTTARPNTGTTSPPC